VVGCENRKAQVNCGEKEYILSLNDKFTIPAKGIYSIYNKSKNKDLELNCHIMKY